MRSNLRVLCVMALVPWVLLGQAGARKVSRVESAEAEVPFAATLPAEARRDILKFFSVVPYKLDERYAAKVLREQLSAQRGEIEKKDPQYFARLEEHVAELMAQAQTEVNKEMGVQFAAVYEAEAESLKADLEKDKPSLLFQGTYRYEAGKRDLGIPGWEIPRVEVRAGRAWSRGGVVLMDKAVGLTAAGVKVTLPIKVSTTLTLTSSYMASSPNAGDLNMPETPAGAQAGLEVKAALTITSENGSVGGNGALTGLSCTWRGDFPRVKATLVADPKTAG